MSYNIRILDHLSQPMQKNLEVIKKFVLEAFAAGLHIPEMNLTAALTL